MENKTERFVIYATESGDYDYAEFEAKDLFDFAREMNDWFGGKMDDVILILDNAYIEPYMWNELSKAFGNPVETQNLLRKIVNSVFNLK